MEHDKELTLVDDLGMDVPPWIEQDITALDVESILQGGCASGAGIAVHFLSMAIELWCSSVESEVDEQIESHYK